MRLIFIDKSARDDAYYFFGALLADADAVRSIEQGLEGVATLLSREIPGFDPATEFHAVDMFHGEQEWKRVPVAWRVKACILVAKILARSTASIVFRGIDLRAHRRRYGARAYPAHLLTLAQLLECVHERLAWVDEQEQLGLVLADEHHTAAGARRSLRSFKVGSASGYTKQPLTRIADTIYFGPSHESRMLQAVDFARYFLNRSKTVEERDPRSAAAVAKIVTLVDEIKIVDYIWCPE
ncbi:DUF3800 domain-containing protein [Curtobacterium sp. ZW137]|uniref:DUF3800 domain-containing protein n=1 Tax=Curtobacterium sp. ZW137 TaxID=2485104 RepID=UPI000F8FF0A4|nr:DUF3800 domain-containing protein [Curtobacterium sp. ZW137]ROP61067.1 uncharacterized protein DUF3800 [Curtobacterium sp. ZW137]